MNIHRKHTAIMAAFVAPILMLGPPTTMGLVAAQDIRYDDMKLVPEDGAAGDSFGISVAIDGNTALVGATGDDDTGNVSGSAYQFDVTTGEQISKLLADAGENDDLFGRSVAIAGDMALVGAILADWDDSGLVYRFDLTTGGQLPVLDADDGALEDYFGISVAVDGTVAIVGSYSDDDNGIDSGSAYLFDLSTGVQQIAKLVPDDGADFDYFGFSVAIHGTRAIVGAYRDDDSGADSGSAYLFDVTTGQQIAKLLPDDAAAGDRFGRSVAIDGTTAIVGAYLDGDNGSASGSAYLFDVTTGEQIVKLLPDDGAAFDLFGSAVAIDGATAIVGAYQDDDNGSESGSAYQFDVTTGEQIAKLLPQDGAVGAWFGSSVAIDGVTAIVGAWGDDDNGAGSGSAYVYHLDDALSLTVDDGSCPGFNTISLCGASEGDRLAIVYGLSDGSVEVLPYCPGMFIDIAQPRVAGWGFADDNGCFETSGSVPVVGCGRLIIQGVNLTSCEKTEVYRF